MSLTHPSTKAVTVPVLAAWAVHALVLRHQLGKARRDPLTHLLTRDGWTARAQRIVAHDQQVAVLLLDVDKFKQINDGYGHATGDRVLIAVAERLERWCGPRGVVGRLGGDEFVVVVRCDQFGRALGERIRDLQAAIGLSHELSPSVSIGYARVSDHPGADLSYLLERADTAMYVAKAARSGQHPADEHLPQARTVNGRREGRPGTGTPTKAMEAAA